MLQTNSRYLAVEDVISCIDPLTSDIKTTLGLRDPVVYDQKTDKGCVHVVQVGDDLFSIALTYYGDASLWWVIADSNIDVIDDPFEPEVGKELFVPLINF